MKTNTTDPQPSATAPAHTPGPWEIDGNEFEYFNPYLVYAPPSPDDDGSRLVAECSTLADAHLIAAAPELLAALRDMVDAVGYMEGDGLGSPGGAAIARSRAAIAKATA